MICVAKRTNRLHAIPFLASTHPPSHAFPPSQTHCNQWLAGKLHNCHVTLLTHVALELNPDHEVHLPMKATNPSQTKLSSNLTFSWLSIFWFGCSVFGSISVSLRDTVSHISLMSPFSDTNTFKIVILMTDILNKNFLKE